MPNDDMGQGHMGVDPNGKSITDETFKVVAASQGMMPEEAKKETLKLLQKIIEKK